jgi:ATP-dependent RNA helicase RhlE
VPETYVHRIGRTGRAGHEGIAIAFCEPEELPYLKDIQKLIGIKIPVVLNHPFISTEATVAIEEKKEQMKEKAKENKKYRGNKGNGDFWRRQKVNQKKDKK